MEMKDGLSQHDRIKRMEATGNFSAIDSRMSTLLQQAEDIAGCIRYYGPDNQPDGYFDELLENIKKMRLDSDSKAVLDGNMEPGQALLYVFLSQMHLLIERFNQRWKKYPEWYLNEISGVEPERHKPDYTWISFVKNTSREVWINKNTGFSYDKANPNNKVFYRLAEDMEVNNIGIHKILSVKFEKNTDIFPSNLFECPTGLKIEEVPNRCSTQVIPPVPKVWNPDKLPLGLCICSPALLLREGKRFVTLLFKPEKTALNTIRRKRNIVALIQEIQKDRIDPISWKDAKEVGLLNLLSNIFHLEISTAGGWRPIEKNEVEIREQKLCVRFDLDEHFPGTMACNEQTHGIVSSYPILKLFLNHDSWLFPYVWLKEFLVRKIDIETRVEGVTHLVFYNQLGQVDVSKPFAPFGINAGLDSWFVLGNYEMAIKKTKSMDVQIEWQQLPRDTCGLYSYYGEYGQDIDNCSFRVGTRYLSDYRWLRTKNNEPMYLFTSVLKDKYGNPDPDSRLAQENTLKNIQLEDAEPVCIPEEAYQYTIRSKNGFVNFSLVAPEMGFGEKIYRQLFTASLLKRKKQTLLNAPVNPMIERISVSYESVDTIDLTVNAANEEVKVYHIYPLGIQQIYPSKENKPQSFVVSLETDANILLALDHVKGNEYINLYLDLLPLKNEVDLSCPPYIAWYWGNGYYWERLPDTSIVKNTTQNLLTSGMIRLFIPATESDKFRDSEGLVWIRMGIVRNESSIAGINCIFTNVAKVYKDHSPEGIKSADYEVNCAGKKLPGIEKIVQITPFTDANTEENEVQKLIRVSEFITHRGRAVTARDYERMALQEFPEVRKVKCLPGISSPGEVTLVVIPVCNTDKECKKPRSSPELLLNIEDYFSTRTSGAVKKVHAINPLYEVITVRCAMKISWTNYSNAATRAIIGKVINTVVAPWQRKKEPPVLGYSFTLEELYGKLIRMKQVDAVIRLSVLHLTRIDDLYSMKEYDQLQDIVAPASSYGVLIPAAEHYILSDDKQDTFGLNEMKMDENFVIWQRETGKP